MPFVYGFLKLDVQAWFPPGLEIRENLEKWEGIFRSGNFVKTGKVREFYSKYWKNQKKLYWKIEKNTGKVREICQPVIVKTLQIWYHTLNKKRTLKNQGNLSVRKSGNHVNTWGFVYYKLCTNIWS